MRISLRVFSCWIAGLLLSSAQVWAAGEPFSHEVLTSFKYHTSAGSFQAEDSQKNLKDSTIDVKFAYGFLTGDVVEPFAEVELSTTNQNLGGLTSSGRKTSWGVGSLFNFRAPGPGRNQKSKWIPYGGIILVSSNRDIDGGDSSFGLLKNSKIQNKLILGTRYMISEQVAINNWVRVSYDKVTDSSETDLEGQNSNINVEVQLIAVSILF